MTLIFQRVFWLDLAGASLVAVIAAVPVMRSEVIDRGFEIAKQSVAEPLTLLALGAAMLAGGRRSVMQPGAATKTAAISFATFLVLAGVSVTLSERPEVALIGSYFRREGLIAWCVYGAFFFAMLGWAHRAGRVVDMLDAILLASIIPAAYTIQQRLGLDFHSSLDSDPARPGGTLGNPLFIAGYLGLLLPLTAVRCWRARGGHFNLLLWSALLLLQGCAFLMAQSRGPLVAVIVGMSTLVFLAAGYARARRVFWVAALLPALAVSIVLAINTLPSAKHWAQGTPVLSRLVFDLDRNAGEATWLASRSAATRLGLWGASTETFAAAPLQHQLLGYGPESAYMHYFPYLPASLMRTEGYWQKFTWDRFHADTLDIGLNFGLLGWFAYCLFFAAVMYASARALFGLSGSGPPLMFFGLMFAGGALSAVAMVQAGLGSAAVPSFGLGIGAGWILFMVGCAWRALKHGIPRTVEVKTGDWALLAGLTSALLVFWIDAQVNIPVLTTRLISFGIAALMLVIAGKMVAGEADVARGESAAGDSLWVWGVGFSLVAACASFLPIVSPDATLQEQETQHWWRRAMPMLTVVVFALPAGWAQVRRSGGGGKAVRSLLAVALGLPLLYSAAHFALVSTLGSELSLSDVQRISIASFASPLFICGMCIALAMLAGRGAAPATPARPRLRAVCFSIFALAASVLSVAYLDWRATRADVASWGAQWVSGQQPQLSEQLLEEAIRLMPYERFYRRQLIFYLLERAVADVQKLAGAPDRYPTLERNLAGAERQARETQRLFPHDPWSVLALANVLQVRALRLLRPHDRAGGANAAQEANQLFARAHQMFPVQPLVLRNWAQLLFDQGNVPDAYQLLDLMEKLIPDKLEPYSERIIMARQVGDSAVVSATVERARAALDKPLFSQLLTVANAQQN